ncbi:unnamed protein product [Rhizophagus irregularis]|nr:unnamed protein product [Rhizophagus irregularis]
MGKSVKELNEEVASQSDKVDDDSGCSHDNYSEEEMSDESDSYNDDGYNGYDGYNEYGEVVNMIEVIIIAMEDAKEKLSQ